MFGALPNPAIRPMVTVEEFYPIRQYKLPPYPPFLWTTKPLFDKTWKLPDVEKLTAN